jgi:hypothetical protein
MRAPPPTEMVHYRFESCDIPAIKRVRSSLKERLMQACADAFRAVPLLPKNNVFPEKSDT